MYHLLFGTDSMNAFKLLPMSLARSAMEPICEKSSLSSGLLPVGVIFLRSMILKTISPLLGMNPRHIGLCATRFRVTNNLLTSSHKSSAVFLSASDNGDAGIKALADLMRSEILSLRDFVAEL